MSIFYCQCCASYVDSDEQDCGIHPTTEQELCQNCFEDFLAVADYNPQDFE